MPPNSLQSNNSGSTTTPQHHAGGTEITSETPLESCAKPEGLMTITAAMDCPHCMRSKGPLFCFRCGYWMEKGRVAKPCSQHPKVIFYTDFKACPKCKSKSEEFFRELD